MRKLFALRLFPAVLVLLSNLPSHAQGITTPRPASPGATVSQKIGISTVTVNYSRPAVKGREIWGNLVPYGWVNQGVNGTEIPWRAGANENTVLTLSHPANVEGKKLEPGNYGLFFVVNEDNTAEVIFSKDYRSWGSFWYNKEHDAHRSRIKLRDNAHTELLTFDFVNVNRNSADLVLNWEKKQLPVHIEFAVDDIVMDNATEELKGPVGFSWQGYSSAANYALQNKTHYDDAVKWIDQAINQNKNFQTLSIKAGLMKEMNKAEESDKLMTEAIGIANENELNLYGYQLLNEGKHDKAIEMFILNTKRFPKSANTWDSLGEGYAIKGDKKNAITNFKKSLSMNPPANVRANSEKYLKQLEAN